ncbi:carboxymuconolactone decarboxylase family protein [Alkalicoccobacillus gibsonii]|uniref:carboxymuconolactone decarboxylase family protein n=1 Tax=Alkalicoccobacillus gibsonii TaxID=79881 RepID=UPI003516B885
MARISLSNNGDTPFQRLLGHNVKVMDYWSQLGNVLEKDGLLTFNLKEQVRRSLAQKNGCTYCRLKGKPISDDFDEKTSIAVGFSEVFLKCRGIVPDSLFNELKRYFKDEEIIELCAFIAFTTASQYFGAVMKLQP